MVGGAKGSISCLTERSSFLEISPTTTRLDLMNKSALVLLETFRDIVIGIGMSDEYRFSLHFFAFLYERLLL